MSEYDVRACRPEDAPSVADLLNVVAQASGGHLELPAEAIENVVNEEVLDPAQDTRVLTDRQGRAIAVGWVRLPPDGGHRVTLTGAVHPDWRGQGIGQDLLNWQLARASVRQEELAPEDDWLAQVDAGAADTTALRLYERLGFSVERYFVEMLAPTVSTPAALPPPGVKIVPYAPERDGGLHAVHTAAFVDTWGYQERTFDSWAALTVRSKTFVPELGRLALMDDQLVGYVLPYADGPETLYIGQVGTADGWRRQGIATAVLADVLAAAHAHGYSEAALETDATSPTDASSAYAKSGFVTTHRIVVYQRGLRVPS
jgi:GNAT superfamily N-acetyltransferase